jgi:phage shock protein C
MNRHDRRNDWTTFFALVLIVIGVWLLISGPLAAYFAPLRQLLRLLASVAFPLALIALGVFVYLAASRGSLRPHAVGSRPLYRSRDDRMLAGVLGGVARFLGIEATWLRLGYALVTFVTGFGPGLLIYIIATVIIPEEPSTGTGVEPPVWPQAGVPTQTPPAGGVVWPERGRETVQTPEPPVPPAPPQPPAGPPQPPFGER